MQKHTGDGKQGEKMPQLNLGAGFVVHKDWIAVDIADYEHNIVADILDGLPFEDNYFDFVLMNHTLQVFTYNELSYVLQEVKRVMKEGATLRILTPDLEKAVQAWQQEKHSFFPIDDSLELTISGKFARYVFWHGETRCAFNEFSLTDLLMRNGFRYVTPGRFGDCELDSREAESLVMVCQK